LSVFVIKKTYLHLYCYCY